MWSNADVIEPVVIKDRGGREVVKFTTPSGVTAWMDRSIPSATLDGLIRKLQRRLTKRLGPSGTR